MKVIRRLLGFLLFVSCHSAHHKEALSPSAPVKIPISGHSELPYLIEGDDGVLYFSWIEKKDGGLVAFKYSTLENETWSAPELIASGHNWFVNWADYPMLAVNRQGDMLAHYLTKSGEDTYSYDINIVSKKAEVGAWSLPLVPHSDHTPTEHGFVTMLPLPNGKFQVAWLDGRNTGESHHTPHHNGAMTIRTALIDRNGNLSGEKELDNRVCDCCQTTGITTENGPIFMYRDRSEMEIRDISIVRKVNQRWTPSLPVARDDWDLAGCPVNGPSVHAMGNKLVLAWYTSAHNQPKVKVIFSDNGGETFGSPMAVDNVNPLGRVDVAMVNANEAIIIWLTSEGANTVIKGRKVRSDGSMGNSFSIAETSASRSSGFPQLAIHGNTAYYAWSQPNESHTTIKMSKMNLVPN